MSPAAATTPAPVPVAAPAPVTPPPVAAPSVATPKPKTEHVSRTQDRDKAIMNKTNKTLDDLLK
jgi:hypothetical protein